jgi:alanyl-tRNA synthetase
LRRVLRRAVRYGRTLGFHEPFFFKLVDIVAKTMGKAFPEIFARKIAIEQILLREEEAFNKTLDQGMLAFEAIVSWIPAASASRAYVQLLLKNLQSGWPHGVVSADTFASLVGLTREIVQLAEPISRVRFIPLGVKRSIARLAEISEEHEVNKVLLHQPNVRLDHLQHSLEEFERFVSQLLAAEHKISGEDAFVLYDTYGFPLDLTELMARERGFSVDVAGFEELMEGQRSRARAAHKKNVIEVTATGVVNSPPTEFVGYEKLDVKTTALGPSGQKWLIVEQTPFYAAMGGQVSDTGKAQLASEVFQIKNVRKVGAHVFVHWSERDFEVPAGSEVRLTVDVGRRHAIERHHTVTHLLHWALHEIVSRDAVQKGSYVGPDKLTFDFSSAALTPQQRADVEKLVNDKIAENAAVSWMEIPYAEAKKRSDIQQFFGEKYGDTVRVLQIGGEPKALNGYSMELCGGTHVRTTSEIGPFRIVSEYAIAAGIRRIEAVAGEAARAWAEKEAARQEEKFEMLMRKKSDIAALPVFVEKAETSELLKQIDTRAAHLEKLEAEVHDWEKRTAKAAEADLQSRAAKIANEIAESREKKDFCVAEVPNADGKLLQAVVDRLKSKFKGPIFLVGAREGNVALIAAVPKELASKFQANQIIQQIAPIIGGKGGGRPDIAQGAGKNASKIDIALAEAKKLLS